VARNSQLLQLVTMLRAELGRSTNVAVGVDDIIGLKQKLRDNQELLYDDYDWPFLYTRYNVPLLTSERYYDVPNGLNLERIEQVWIYYGNLPRPLTRIIDERDYAYFNSDLGITADPALKWDVRSTGDTTTTGELSQLEVWPIPASNNQTMIVRGIRQLRPLIRDADVADLDDQIIVLLTAAELLAKSESPSADAVMKRFQKRLSTLKGRRAVSDRRYRIGMGVPDSDRPNKIVVRAS
jgi:hypothetical protein